MEDLSELSKDEIRSEVNALQHKDRWDGDDCRYYEELMHEFHRKVELEIQD